MDLKLLTIQCNVNEINYLLMKLNSHKSHGPDSFTARAEGCAVELATSLRSSAPSILVRSDRNQQIFFFEAFDSLHYERLLLKLKWYEIDGPLLF